MAFTSQYEKTKKTSRRTKSDVIVTQSFKKSTKSEEMSFRISREILNDAGIGIGEKVDILRDNKSNRWMIQCVNSDGFSISGKADAPTGLIRYTIKEGHYKLTNRIEDLPYKQDFNGNSIETNSEGKYIILSELSEFLK